MFHSTFLQNNEARGINGEGIIIPPPLFTASHPNTPPSFTIPLNKIYGNTSRDKKKDMDFCIHIFSSLPLVRKIFCSAFHPSLSLLGYNMGRIGCTHCLTKGNSSIFSLSPPPLFFRLWDASFHLSLSSPGQLPNRNRNAKNSPYVLLRRLPNRNRNAKKGCTNGYDFYT